MDRLSDLRKEGTSIIMISHDMRLVAEYATTVALFNKGNIIFHGEPKDLFKRSELLKIAALKEPPICSIAAGLTNRGFSFCQDLIKVDDFVEMLSR